MQRVIKIMKIKSSIKKLQSCLCTIWGRGSVREDSLWSYITYTQGRTKVAQSISIQPFTKDWELYRYEFSNAVLFFIFLLLRSVTWTVTFRERKLYAFYCDRKLPAWTFHLISFMLLWKQTCRLVSSGLNE